MSEPDVFASPKTNTNVIPEPGNISGCTQILVTKYRGGVLKKAQEKLN